MRLILTATAAALLLPSAAFAQAGPESTATAQASAEVVAPLTISCTTMKFGRLAPLPTSSATVTINANGGFEDPQNIVVPGSVVSGNPSSCTVRGEYQLGYKVTLPTSSVILNAASNPMELDNFNVSTDDALPPTDRVLGDQDAGGGFDGFNVGATLHVDAAEAPGLYTGTFVVSVQYN